MLKRNNSVLISFPMQLSSRLYSRTLSRSAQRSQRKIISACSLSQSGSSSTFSPFARRRKKWVHPRLSLWAFGLVGEVIERGWIVWVLKRMNGAVEEKVSHCSVEGHATCVISTPCRSFRGRPLRQIVQWLTRVLHSPNSGRSCKLASSA
jgi:hypothetical protein